MSPLVACEQPFIFHVLSETPAQSAEDGSKYHIDASEAAFSTTVVNHWGQMAASGNPNSSPRPETWTWPAWTEEEQVGMVFGGDYASGGTSGKEAKLRSEKCDFWDDHLFDKELHASAAQADLTSLLRP